MDDYNARLTSLQASLGTLFSSAQLKEFARAGFYNAEVPNDRHSYIRCIYCKGCLIGQLKPDDDPWIIHAEAYVPCIHLWACKGKDFINKVLMSEPRVLSVATECKKITLDYSHIEVTVPDLSLSEGMTIAGLSNWYEHRNQRALSANGAYSSSLYLTPRRWQYRSPRLPLLIGFKNRVDSLLPIPNLSEVRKQIMAEAGLCYYGGVVKCYWCEKQFGHESSLKTLLYRHVIVSPDCFHVIFTIGEDHIEDHKPDGEGFRSDEDKGIKRTRDESDEQDKLNKVIFQFST